MSKGFQRVVILGTLGKDVEAKNSGSGKLVANFSVAVNGYKDKVEWFNVNCWEKTAEIARDYLKKGSTVLIEGEMETRSWEQGGQKRFKTELVARGITLLGDKPKAEKNVHGLNVSNSDLPDFDQEPF